jgi:hypothetical protein
MSLSELKTQIRIQKLVRKSCEILTGSINKILKCVSRLQKLKHKDAEISKLQAALRLFTSNNASQEPIKVDEE